MSKGDLIADALPSWEGTPFHDRARVRGAGCDCKGLLWGAADDLGFPEAQSEYARTLEYDLSRRDGVPSARLREGFAALFDRVEEMKRGDVLLCRWGDKPGHIAISDGEGRAWSALPNSGVKRRKLSTLLHRFPLDSIWRWRD